MSPLKKTVGILRHLGPRWIAFRVWHASQMRSGVMLRRDPNRTWNQFDDDAGFLTAAPKVLAGCVEFRKLAAEFSTWDAAAAEPPVLEAMELLQGKFRYFGWKELELGARPAWLTNPLTGESFPVGQHWSKISDFAKDDIKVIWEPSRWGWAFVLARAFARTRDRRFAVHFYQLVNNWMETNLPGAGPNWKCGQEAALRLIAASTATAIFAACGEVDKAWLAKLCSLAEATGRRIEANLGYALSQDNNHGLSELVGLLTVAVMFPALPEAQKYRRRARLGLIRELNRLVATDGSFAQYSTNYHRVLLHDAVWCGRLLAAAGAPLPANTLARIDAAAVWLWQLTDPSTGSAPCYGSNDGANILKLDGGIYGDYRAALQAAFVFTRGVPVLPPGYWDETAAWLFGAKLLAGQRGSAPERGDFIAPSAGYHVLRRAGMEVFVRCGPHRFRPHHADQLHVDLRRDSVPLTLDPGTFSYNAPPPWDHAFKNTRFHNTVSVDGLDQMEKAGRFLWLPWTSGKSDAVRELAEGVLCWEGETDAWLRLSVQVRHRRSVLLHSSGETTVIDRLQSTGEHEYRLHWLLPDAHKDKLDDEFRAVLTGADGFVSSVATAVSGGCARADWVRADERTGRGWASPRYLEKLPAWSWEIRTRAINVIFATHFGCSAAEMVFPSAESVQVAGVTFSLGQDGVLVRDARAEIFNV